MSQDQRRRNITVHDQHGRSYDAVIEIATGSRVGPLNPLGWRSPLPTPDRFILHVRNDPYRVQIDYDAWAASVVAARETYEERRRKAALEISAQGTVQDVLRQNPPELVDIVGPPPNVPPIEAVQAARAGNRWILLMEGDPPEAALRFDYFAQYRPGYKAPLVKAGGGVSFPDVDPFSEAPTVDPPEMYSWDFDRGYVTFPDGSRHRGKEVELLEKLADEFPEHHVSLALEV